MMKLTKEAIGLLVGVIEDYKNEDNRPLTDETLKELGFKGTGYSDEYMQDTPQSLTTDGGVVLMVWHQEGWDGDKIWVEIANCTDEKRPKFKTVGSVKKLIEALKGDE